QGDEDKELAPSAETWLFLKPLFLAEVGVARQIHALRQGPHPMSGANVVAMLKWVEERMRLTLAETQRAAIEAAATQKVLVITGGPGVGKATLVRRILEVFTSNGLPT